MSNQFAKLLLTMSHRKFLGYKIVVMFLAAFWYTAAIAVHIGFEAETIPVVYDGQEVVVRLSESVKDIAYELSKIFGIVTDQQKLVMSDSGKVIPFTKKALQEYVTLGDAVALQLQKVDSQVREVVVKNRSNQSFEFLIDRLTTLEDLQKEIQKRFRIPLGIQKVFLQGIHKLISENKPLQEQVAQNSVLYVEG